MVKVISTKGLLIQEYQGTEGWAGSDLTSCEDLLETLDVPVPEIATPKQERITVLQPVVKVDKLTRAAELRRRILEMKQRGRR